jgi:hypothetical protein
VQQQVRRFIEGVIAAVPEKQLFGIEAGDGVAQQVAQSAEIGGGHALSSQGGSGSVRVPKDEVYMAALRSGHE